MTEFSPEHQAFLLSQDAREAFADLSAAEINRMDMDAFARLTGRATPTATAYDTLYGTRTDQAGPTATPAAQALDGPSDPQGVSDPLETPDFAAMSNHEYAAWRAANGIGQQNDNGHVVGSPSGGFGRHEMSVSNVEAPRRISSMHGYAQAQADAEHARLSGLRAAQRANYNPGV